MKNWRLFWKKKLEQQEYWQLCRDEKIGENTKFIFLSEWGNNGPCFGGSAVWIWSNDIMVLASYMLEINLREKICTDNDIDFDTTFDKKCVQLAKDIYSTSDGESKSYYLQFIKRLDDIVNNEFTLEKFTSWMNDYNKISCELSVLSDSVIIDNLPSAIELLETNEKNRLEDNSDMSLQDRFDSDCIC